MVINHNDEVFENIELPEAYAAMAEKETWMAKGPGESTP